MAHEPIAIIGSGCRFPGRASTPSKLWELLRQPRDVLRKIDRYNYKGFYHPDSAHHGTTNVQDSYLLVEDHRVFDAQFFNIKPVEADAIDPMQRILLETVYESIENAGQTIEGLQGSNTAFYVGVMSVDYVGHLTHDLDTLPTYFATGTSRAIISNRISFFFDWHGPSMTIDTACSSSMIALHQAVHALRSGESRVAVAAGADLILGPEVYIGESKLNMLSPSSRSRMWDVDADGYARGEGFASLVLKKLSDAIVDGDHIECIVRETATNQDGRSKGITMPNASAQVAMIRDVYKRGGLDLNKREDRPQFFEAHGTGTKAGDPLEAEAICRSFFGTDVNYDDDEILHVGSIKTVIGHTEGTAGLAGVMKASLALQHGIIPPNLLFNKLNPDVEPFYQHLRIPTVPKSWPKPQPGTPRRASVNSFGFGGSNAHAILESYEPVEQPKKESTLLDQAFIPFTFSATSERSLAANLASFLEYLKSHEFINPRDLAWTLQSRRSKFQVRAAIGASSIQSLIAKLDAKLEALKSHPNIPLGIRTTSDSSRVLGVFTGQGAQWASMGKELIKSSEYVRDAFGRLELSLARLPEADRPSWLLTEELTKSGKDSRLAEAALAQPLCTAIQIVLVDLLKCAGVQFAAVVGHSSGEIGAAYATGYISAEDAIRIAYYRGFHAKLAGGSSGSKGAMLAAGTSLEDAQELCALPIFDGRISVAASNSASSVTLSGDMDLIEHAKIVFEDEKKFAKLLKVDTAYHSHHMYPCSDVYVASLKACDIKILEPDQECTWYSSVKAHVVMKPNEELKATYWKDNMVNAVLFSQAIESATNESGRLALTIEVGPHPALKGPTSQTIQDKSGSAIAYTGVLNRGSNDVEALSDALGSIWGHLGSAGLDLTKYDQLISGSGQCKLVSDLPTYSWDHNRVYWHESRASRAFLMREHPPHPLLGVTDDGCTDRETRWRNLLLRRELPWLEGHQIQHQIVFPAAGYVSMAVEASKTLAQDQPIKLIEVEDLVIGRAITFDDEASGVETLSILARDQDEPEKQTIRSAEFLIYACLKRDNGHLTMIAKCKVQAIIGYPESHALPSVPNIEPNLLDIDLDKLYANFDALGFNYSGPFREMTSMQRKLGFARGVITRPAGGVQDEELTVQPVELDISFQGVISTWFSPGDGRLWTIVLPRSIKRVRINPSLCTTKSNQELAIPWKSTLTDERTGEITGDVEIFTADGSEAAIQVDGLTLVALKGTTAITDRQFYSEIVWGTAAPDGKLAAGKERASSREKEIVSLCERVALFYWRKMGLDISPEAGAESTIRYHDTVPKLLSRVGNGKHPYVEKEWNHDTADQIAELLQRYPESIDLKLISTIGKSLSLGATRIHPCALEEMVPTDMLDEFYERGLAFQFYNSCIAIMASQIAHRYPCMDILELDSGRGTVITKVLEKLGDAYDSYTCVGKPATAFEAAQKSLPAQVAKISFKTLDIEVAPASQGFSDNSYDLVIATTALQTSSKLETVLKHVRSLLRPGGYLLLLVMTDAGSVTLDFILGCLPGWFSGTANDRSETSCISPSRWNTLLRQAGFSGIDTVTPDRDPFVCPLSAISTQAVDDRVNYLRRPLMQTELQPQIDHLCILGGTTLDTSRMLEDLEIYLRPVCHNTTLIETIDNINDENLPSMCTVISLVDVDEPIFQKLSDMRWAAMKLLFDRPRNILWLTRGRKAEEPYASMTVGFWRSAVHEMPHVHVQFLDIDPAMDLDARIIAETLLRFHALDKWDRDGTRGDLLWSIEPEFSLETGPILIPRTITQKAPNDRLNSLRRPITTVATPGQETLQIDPFEDSYHLRMVSSLQLAQTHRTEGFVVVQISYSLLSALRVHPSAMLYLGLGSNVETGQSVLFLSESNASIVKVPKELAVPCNVPAELWPLLLLSVAGEILAESLLGTVPDCGALVIHEPNALMASIFVEHASKGRIRILLTTSQLASKDDRVKYINHSSSQYAIRKALPTDVALFVDFSGDKNFHSLGYRMAACLPPNCDKETTSTLFNQTSLLRPRFKTTQIHEILDHAALAVGNKIHGQSYQLPIGALPLERVLDGASETLPMSILDWTVSRSLPVTIESINPQTLFSKEKTYFLVGLTGEVGRSICQWMAQSGAGHIIMTSRSPNVDPKWLETIEATGATVKVFAADVTDRDALQTVYDEVTCTFPPIAGVANAAMVLKDQLFLDMDLESMKMVLKPKVDGTNNLNDLFADTHLDFFVLFSSLICVIGNEGQSNYSAANMYMTALAAQRKKRGLAASVMDIGRVVGVGYLGRADQSIDERLARYGMLAVSEVDLHHHFAEAIVAGRPDSPRNPELISGLTMVDKAEDNRGRMRWTANPILSHFVRGQKGAEAKKEGRQGKSSVKVQLQAAASRKEALEILNACFALKMQIILQLPPNGVSNDVPLVELGVDSLVAVEVRTWFLKELATDMPVLKILGGASVADLCRLALDKLPAEFLPELGVKEDPAVVKQKASLDRPKPDAHSNISEIKPPILSPSNASSSSIRNSSMSPDNQAPRTEQMTQSTSVTSLPDSQEEMTPAMRTIKLPFIQKTSQTSVSQARFWFLGLYIKDQSLFNVAFYHRLTGSIDIPRLEYAVKTVGQHYEALRTCFFADSQQMDRPLQGVMTTSSLHLEKRTISDHEDAASEFARLEKYVFNIERGETMRIMLLTISPTSHYIIFAHHHIIMDGISFQVFLADLEKAYNKKPLSEVFQYPDFATSQRLEIENGSMKDDLSYWQEEYPNTPCVLPLLPMAKTNTRKALTTYKQNRIWMRLDRELATRIKATCIKHKATPFHFYLATLQILLFRVLDTDDLCIGIADANRNDSRTMSSIGFYLNLLPLRFRRRPSATFADAIQEARTKAYSALGHSRVPFDMLLDALNVPRSASHTPLFQVFCDYRQGAEEKPKFGNCQLELTGFESGKTGYDLSLDITESSKGSVILIKGQNYLYSRSDIEIVLKSYINLLEAFSRDPDLTGEIPRLFSDGDVKQAIQLGRGPTMELAWPATIAHRIDDMVNAHGDECAVKDGHGAILTYKQLAQRANAISNAMFEAKVIVGSNVAVFQEPTADWICSLLAVLRVGAVYVPLDLRNPLPRLAAITKTCQPAAILSHTETARNAHELGAPTAKVINISTLPHYTEGEIDNKARSDAPAVILFTSGSTGTPKGILLGHASIRNELEGYTKTFNFGQEMVLQQSAFSFDFSMEQIFLALANGGCLYVVPKAKRGDPIEITKLIREEGITYTKATPSEYSTWIQYGADHLVENMKWKTAFGGGEPITQKLKREFKSLNMKDLRLYNGYGPAECSLSSAKCEIAYNHIVASEPIPAGFPLPNYSVYIVDKELNALPVGMPGEVAIGGAGLALGYLNDEELTKQKFVRNPFASDEYISRGWIHMYLSGDRARLRDDGALLYEGRIDGDNLIKLRGLRIDLMDIEATIIQQSKGVLLNVIVTVRGDPQYLVAHVVFHDQISIEERESFLQQHLASLPLPQYMIPAMAIPLDKLPLNNHSKADRLAIKALPLPEMKQSAECQVELTETELQLKHVWEKTLSKEIASLHAFDPDTNFFHVGGNSLLLVKLQSLIRQTFDVALPLITLFDASTLGSMACKIRGSASVGDLDWEQELAVSKAVFQSESSFGGVNLSGREHGPGKTVVLTGATGYLGGYILRHLVTHSEISKIICVGIRPTEGGQIRSLPIQSEKIVTFHGDLTAPHLGLEVSRFNALASEADVIIHCGAKRSFWDSYHQLRKVNVDSTREVVKMAFPRKIPIHFISSGGILHLAGEKEISLGEESVSAFPPPVDGSDGYVASKWASENYLENAARELGTPVSIYRFVPAREKTSPPAHILQDFLKYATQMQTIASRDGWDGDFDLIPVHSVAHGICDAVVARGCSPQATATARFKHYHSNIKISVKEVFEYVEKHLEGKEKMTTIPSLQWVGKIKPLGFEYLFASHDVAFRGKAEVLVSRR